MIAWTALQDAIYTWVTDTSGLNEDRFGFDQSGAQGLDEPLGFGTSTALWAFQAAPQPRLPYAMLKLSPARKIGGLDELNITQDLTAPRGHEIITTVRGHREVTLTIEVFSNSVTAGKTAMDYIERALTSLRLPSQLSNLRAGGLSLVGWDNVLDLTAIVSTAYQSRAQVDVKFYLLDSVSETVGYIETVDVTATVDGEEIQSSPFVDVTAPIPNTFPVTLE